MYDTPTQFQLQGSQIGALPSTLDSVNPAYYGQIEQFIQANGGRLASVFGLRLYDTLRVDAGIQPLTTFNFFQNGVSQSQGLWVLHFDPLHESSYLLLLRATRRQQRFRTQTYDSLLSRCFIRASANLYCFASINRFA